MTPLFWRRHVALGGKCFMKRTGMSALRSARASRVGLSEHSTSTIHHSKSHAEHTIFVSFVFFCENILLILNIHVYQSSCGRNAQSCQFRSDLLGHRCCATRKSFRFPGRIHARRGSARRGNRNDFLWHSARRDSMAAGFAESETQASKGLSDSKIFQISGPNPRSARVCA